MKKLTLPLSMEERRGLRAGEGVLLSGTVYTARDAAHKRLHEMILNGEELPFDLHEACIYYVGPTPATQGRPIGSAGPTTSSRMDPYTPELIHHGLRYMIGKGRRSEEVKEAIRQYDAIYFVTVGGAGALLSHCVKKRRMVAFEDLLAEAVTELYVEDFPCYVGIDRYGNDIYDEE
ncbi:MAG: fumarate hydratase C-terminal domain-containing protein [Solobacterium sp.]|nr:fumarate hydratase C-terminal domain-containing protein [Solobacterium sp.]